MKGEIKKTRVKTKYNDLLWVHQKYVEHVAEGGTLVIIHDGQEMTVTAQSLKEHSPVRGKELYQEQWGEDRGVQYRLYGFRFDPDQGILF